MVLCLEFGQKTRETCEMNHQQEMESSCKAEDVLLLYLVERRCRKEPEVAFNFLKSTA